MNKICRTQHGYSIFQKIEITATPTTKAIGLSKQEKEGEMQIQPD
ncbi:hypothetical protein [Arundinibacter roseus]|nr:hypothetical protein [Arundinibacter roseus]